MVEKIEERQHETMVRVLKNYLEEKGYKVKVEPETKSYAGVKADVEATKGKEKICFEIVNGERIDTPEIRAKWEAISGNREWDFSLFVPQDKEKEIKELLEKWAIYFRYLWVYAPQSL
ncbi:hypothetical protein GOV13_04070 [Candidatus Pacearchaeota archaeon]|nr:hypothetical protein [Candidatus Pacearchaeota archaeon]